MLFRSVSQSRYFVFFIPSLVARVGGIIFPIVLVLAKTYDQQDEMQSTGRFLIIASFQGSIIVSAMFLTSMAANPIAVEIAKEFGVTLTWVKWFVAASVPGLVSLAVVPYLISKIIPPKIKESQDAPEVAKTKLKAMGPISYNEWIMMGIFAFVLILWLFGGTFNVIS